MKTWHAVIFECVRFEKQVDSVSHVGTLYVLELRMKLDGHIDQRNKKSKLVERWTIFLLEAEEEAECGRGNCWKKEGTRQNRMNKGRLALIKICTIFRPETSHCLSSLIKDGLMIFGHSIFSNILLQGMAS